MIKCLLYSSVRITLQAVYSLIADVYLFGYAVYLFLLVERYVVYLWFHVLITRKGCQSALAIIAVMLTSSSFI